MELAQTHLALARAHLRVEPNLWLQASIALAQAGLFYQQSNLTAAIEQARYASSEAELSGHLWSRAGAATTCAFLLIRAGQVAEAASWLAEADKLSKTLPIVRIGNLDNAGQLALLAADDDRARTTVSELETRDVERILEQSWYAVAITYTRIRLHRSLKAWETVAWIAAQGLELAQFRSDHNSYALFAACRAEALAALGRGDEAVAELARALESVSYTTLPTLCELDRVMAVVLAGFGEHGLASKCMRRATALAQEIGDAVLIAETNRTALPHTPTAVRGGEMAHDFILRLWHLVSSVKQPRVLSEVLSDDLLEPVVRSCHPAAQAELSAGNVQTEISIGQKSLELLKNDPEHSLRLLPQPDRLSLLSASLLKASVEAMAASQRTAVPPEHRVVDTIATGTDKGRDILIAPSMLRLLDTATRIAATPITVLITGETGTGKEVLARFIHDASDRKAGRFMAVNCSALPRELLESQMFGHRRGAFTGAADSFEGIVKGAEGGTLFLDEVGDLPLDLQPKFLRFLETGEVLPLGSNQPVKVNVRVIAATNANLGDLVAQGRFRSDLYYRLNGIHFGLPPLRSRREEIPAFARHLLDRFAIEFGKGGLNLTREALEHLLVYDWPGNLRQLASELRRVAALAEKDTAVSPDLLSPEITAIPPIAVPPEAAEPTISVSADQRLGPALQAVERTMIARALERTAGRMDDAARLLGISRKGLFLKRRRYRIGAAPRADA